MENEKINKIKQEIEDNKYCIQLLKNSIILKEVLDNTEREQLIEICLKKIIMLCFKLKKEYETLKRIKIEMKMKKKEEKQKNENFTEKTTVI